MREVIAFITAIIVAFIFTAIFGAIIAVISTFIASLGFATYSIGGPLHVSGNILNIFLSFYVGYKVYKRITRVKENKAEE